MEPTQQTSWRKEMINKALLSAAAALMTISTFSVTLGVLYGGQIPSSQGLVA